MLEGLLHQERADGVRHQRPGTEHHHVEQALGAGARILGEVFIHKDVNRGEEEGVTDAVNQDDANDDGRY